MAKVLRPTSFPSERSIVSVLNKDFHLSAAQLAVLPALEDVDLIPQNDSQQINRADLIKCTYHPYKLFIGKNGKDHVYAYLRTGQGGRYKIEITSLGSKTGKHSEPWDARWFGNVEDLAYPYNSFLVEGRFTAVVKWYFVLGYRKGLFGQDPGFEPTASWIKNMQSACNDLIEAADDENSGDESEEEGHVEQRKRKKSPEAVEPIAELNPPTTKAKRRAPQGDEVVPERTHSAFSDRAATKPEQVLSRSRSHSRGSEPPLQHRRTQSFTPINRPTPSGFPPPYSSFAPIQPKYHGRYQGEPSALNQQTPGEGYRRPNQIQYSGAVTATSPMFPISRATGASRREGEEAAERKQRSRIPSQIEATNDKLRRRAMGNLRSQHGKLEGYDGVAANGGRISEAAQGDSRHDGDRGQEVVEGTGVASMAATYGSNNLKTTDEESLGAEYLRLWRQRAKATKLMIEIQAQMSKEGFQALLEKHASM